MHPHYGVGLSRLRVFYDWIPSVNPEIGGESDGPSERWTTGVCGYLTNNNDKPYIWASLEPVRTGLPTWANLIAATPYRKPWPGS